TEVERETEYLFLVLHFPVFAPHTDKIFSSQIGVFLGKDYLVTIHENASPFIGNMFAECQQGDERAEQYFGEGSAYLLYALITKLLGSIEGMTNLVESELDGIEGLVFE